MSIPTPVSRRIVLAAGWWSLVVFAWLLTAPAAQCLDLEVGDAACNVRVATADNRSSTNAPLALKRLQKQFAQAGIRSRFAHQGRPANAGGRTTDDWFLCVLPANVEQARKLVDDAIHDGLHLSADHSPPTREDT